MCPGLNLWVPDGYIRLSLQNIPLKYINITFVPIMQLMSLLGNKWT